MMQLGTHAMITKQHLGCHLASIAQIKLTVLSEMLSEFDIGDIIS